MQCDAPFVIVNTIVHDAGVNLVSQLDLMPSRIIGDKTFMGLCFIAVMSI